MEQQPGRRQGGRPPRPAEDRGGDRAEDFAEDYLQDDPTMVRPFVKAGSGGRRPRQGADGGASGGRSRQAASGASGGQGRQQGGGRAGQPQNGRPAQNGRAPQNGQRAQNEQRTQNSRNRQNNPNVPAPRPAREADPQQVPGLVSTPMPPPRAVARPQRPDLAPYPELDPPMSDLTTTLPILAVPAEEQYDGPDGHAGPSHAGHPAYEPPGEHGHDDADFGRHRSGNRAPRALKAAGLVVGVVVAGVAAYSVFGGGSGTPSAGPAATGTSSAGGGAGTPSDSASPAVAGVPAPTGTPTDSASTSASQTTTSASASHSSKSASKSSSSSHPSTTSAMSPRPSSPPSTTTTTSPPAPPPSVPSPTFTTLGPGSSGPAVTQLQQNLQNLGYWVNVNGNYDSTTQRAVSEFQSVNPGTAQADGRGIYGPATDQALRQAVGG